MVIEDTYAVKHYKKTNIDDFGLEPGQNFRRVMSWVPTINQIPLMMAIASYSSSDKPRVVEPGCGSAFLGRMFLDMGFDYLGFDANGTQLDQIKKAGLLTDNNLIQGNVSDLSRLVGSRGYPEIDMVYNSFMPDGHDWSDEIASTHPKSIILCYEPKACGTDKSFGDIKGYNKISLGNANSNEDLPILLPNDIYWGIKNNEVPRPFSGGRMTIYLRSDIKYDNDELVQEVIRQINHLKGASFTIPWEEELSDRLHPSDN